LKQEIERVIAELEILEQDAEKKAEAFKQKESRMFGLGRVSGLTRAIEMLKEVLTNGTNDGSGVSKADEATQVQSKENND